MGARHGIGLNSALIDQGSSVPCIERKAVGKLDLLEVLFRENGRESRQRLVCLVFPGERLQDDGACPFRPGSLVEALILTIDRGKKRQRLFESRGISRRNETGHRTPE